jgi:hypothetical protein
MLEHLGETAPGAAVMRAIEMAQASRSRFLSSLAFSPDQDSASAT